MTRREKFRLEQIECVARLHRLIAAVRVGDMLEVHTQHESVNTSLEHLRANDPRREVSP